MIEIGGTYFYARSDGKLEQGIARVYKFSDSEDVVWVHMKSTKDGLLDWVKTSEVFQSLGEAMRAKAKRKAQQGWSSV